MKKKKGFIEHFAILSAGYIVISFIALMLASVVVIIKTLFIGSLIKTTIRVIAYLILCYICGYYLYAKAKN